MKFSQHVLVAKRKNTNKKMHVEIENKVELFGRLSQRANADGEGIDDQGTSRIEGQ